MKIGQSNQPIIGVNVPKVYANGFFVGFTLADLNITLVLNGQPTQQVIMSLIAAKTLRNILNDTIRSFEEKTKIDIPDMNQIQELLNKK